MPAGGFVYTGTGSFGSIKQYFPKSDLDPIGSGDPLKYVQSLDWNPIPDALDSLRYGITSGTLFGFVRSTSSPTGSAGGVNTDYIWVDVSGNLMQHLANGTDRFLSGNVTAGGSGLTYVPSLSASYSSTTSTSGNIISVTASDGPVIIQVGQPTSQGALGTLFQVRSGSVSMLAITDNGQQIYRSLVGGSTPANVAHLFDSQNTMSANQKFFRWTTGNGQFELGYIRSPDGTHFFANSNSGIDTTGSLATLNVGALSASIVNIGRWGAQMQLSGNVSLSPTASYFGGILPSSVAAGGIKIIGDGPSAFLELTTAGGAYFGYTGNYLAFGGAAKTSVGGDLQSDGASNLGNAASPWPTVTSKHFVGGGSAPTITKSWGAGTNAGVGATVTVSGTDAAHLISLTTATGTLGNQAILSGNFAVAFGTIPLVDISPGNLAAATALSGVYISSDDTNNAGGVRYVLKVGPSALTPSTLYKFYITATG